MKAEQARAIANDVLISNSKKQYEKALFEIKDAANKGKFKTWVSGEINKYVKDILIKDGYKINIEAIDEIQCVTTISWEE